MWGKVISGMIGLLIMYLIMTLIGANVRGNSALIIFYTIGIGCGIYFGESVGISDFVESIIGKRKMRIKQKEIRRNIEERNRIAENIRKEILSNAGYELDIIPFLKILDQTEISDIAFHKMVNELIFKGESMKKYSRELNDKARRFNVAETLNVHIK